VYAAIEQLDAEVWVVDNASSDNSISYLQSKFPWVKFIANPANAGFGRANNQALKMSSGEYVLFLNPDTLIPENSLTKCIAFLQANRQAGALGIRMIDGSGIFLPESKRSFPSPLTSFYKLAGMSSLFPKSPVFSRYSLAYLNEYKDHEVDVLAGAFMLVKKDIVMELKGFDEAFFMYGEDIDLSYRIQKMGYKNYYFSGSTIIHFKGESTQKQSIKYVKMFYRAMSIFVRKHYSGKSAYLFGSFIHIAIWLRAVASATLQFGKKTKSMLFSQSDNLGKFFKNNWKSKKQYETIIAGTEEEYEEIKALLAKAGLDKKIKGRVEIDKKTKNVSEIVLDVKALAESGEIGEIIFCQGNVDYSYIIKQVQDLAGKISMRFHGKGTESIVGSDSKNKLGEVVYAGEDVQVKN